jgi:3-deoxy-D-manno-octulosonate 8-phosphate phosphatase (KDO 8-P phosphatase)
MAAKTAAARAAAIRLLVLDIDGVLTDGRVVYDDQGGEIKYFDVTDGHGIKLLMRAGVKVALLSGRKSRANRTRARDLGIEELIEDCKVKLPAFESLLSRKGVEPHETAYMGDDLIDLPPMRAAGLALAPASARLEARRTAHWVSPRPGGRGAVRDACELILKASGKWEEVTKRYF